MQRQIVASLLFAITSASIASASAEPLPFKVRYCAAERPIEIEMLGSTSYRHGIANGIISVIEGPDELHGAQVHCYRLHLTPEGEDLHYRTQRCVVSDSDGDVFVLELNGSDSVEPSAKVAHGFGKWSDVDGRIHATNTEVRNQNTHCVIFDGTLEGLD